MNEIFKWDYLDDNNDNNKNQDLNSPKSPEDDFLKWLDLWYREGNQPKNEKLVPNFSNNSIEWRLMQNEQIQFLLSEVLSEYKNYIWTDKDRLKILINKEKAILEEQWKQFNEDQSKIIESMYEYMLDNDNETWFENFILTNGIYTIKTYLQNHLDKDWKPSFVSVKEIKARLKIDWFINLYKWYREKHTENSEALGKLEQEMMQFNNVANYVKNSIDLWIQKYLSWKYWKDELAQYLSKFLLEAKNNENLKALLDGKDKNSIIWVIRYWIKEYARLLNISDNNPQLGDPNNWDRVFNMQIRSYLYLYWVITHSKNFNSDNWTEESSFDPKKWLDDVELWEILRSILMADWVMKNDWNNKYLKSEVKLQNAQTIEDIERRKASRARINLMKDWRPNAELKSNKENKKTFDDVNIATWAEIAGELWLWRKIKIKRKEARDVTENPHLKREILRKTWNDFVRRNQWILSKYFDISEISKFFNLRRDWISFNNKAWESFKNKWTMEHPESNTDELNIVENLLQWLPIEYENNLERAWIFVDKKIDQKHEIIKNYAIGAVIDIIKDMFQNIIDTNSSWNLMTGFEFNWENPAKIKGDCLLLRWKFNWETINIKYNINTWKLYMNSFISEMSGGILINWSTKPSHELWDLKPFKDVLDDFYKTPTESMNSRSLNLLPRIGRKRKDENTNDNKWWEQKDAQSTPAPSMRWISEAREKFRLENKRRFQLICWTKLDEISGKIKDKIESKSLREPVALNLLRTLGVVPKGDWTINLVWWNNPSDLCKIVQLITSNKNTPEDLNKFSGFTKTLFDYIWLKWWQNSDHQDKTWEKAKIIFDESNKQEYISRVRDNTKNFDTEYSHSNGKAQFNEWTNFWLLKLVEDNFIEGDYPNRKLSSNNMETFMERLGAELDLETSLNI